LDLHLVDGWTGIVGTNGSGKTTLLQLATQELNPQAGSIQAPGLAIYCPQRTDHMPTQFPRFLDAHDNYPYLEPLRIGYDWDQRWQTLSHGMRKRAQVAVALWQNPDLLAIDEPTNHLDREARARIHEALAAYRGIGLLVSHDRQLLDSLCTRCLFLEAGQAVLRDGNYSQGKQEETRETLEQQRVYQKAKGERKRLEREVKRAREEANQAQRRLSKRKLAPKDHGAKAKVDGARLTGKDAVPGRLMNRLETRMKREAVLERDHKSKTELGIRFEKGRIRKKRFYEAVAQTIQMGSTLLNLPVLTVDRGDRIGLLGPNGAGKSTLIHHIQKNLSLTDEEVLFLPQEISKEQTREIIDEIKRLPGEKKGRLLQLVSRLGSDPKRILDSQLPSPGETRKLLLAKGLIGKPALIIMDEPTNHLDLSSVECLEQALAEVDCALLLVSHDSHFIGTLSELRWELLENHDGGYHLEKGGRNEFD